MSLIKDLLRPIARSYTRLRWKYNAFVWREKVIKPGNAISDKQYFIIRRREPNVGLFSYYITVLGNIKYALMKNYHPVVDMKNYPNTYLKKEDVGHENSWEYFFEQPNGNSLCEAYKCRKVILSSGEQPSDRPDTKMKNLCFTEGSEAIQQWRKIARLVPLSKKANNTCKEAYDKIIKPGDYVMGLAYRSTDYAKLKPLGHPIQPSMEQLIEQAKLMFDKKKVNKIFVSTDDPEFINVVKKEFGDIVVSNERSYVQYKGGLITEYNNEEDDSKIIQGMEYLATIYILSQCNIIIAGRNSGTLGAMLLSDGFDDSYFFDLGEY